MANCAAMISFLTGGRLGWMMSTTCSGTGNKRSHATILPHAVGGQASQLPRPAAGNNVHNAATHHLTALQQRVAQELACLDSNLAVGHGVCQNGWWGTLTRMPNKSAGRVLARPKPPPPHPKSSLLRISLVFSVHMSRGRVVSHYHSFTAKRQSSTIPRVNAPIVAVSPL